MKKLLLILFAFTSATLTQAQVKVGFMGGANQSTIIETSDMANWSSIKSNYEPIIGYHGGIFAEFGLNKKRSLSFQPAVVYFNKGRKYSQQFNPVVTLKDSSVKQLINYIDIPLHLIGRIKLARKINFIIGVGPYASFFLSGREKTTTTNKGDTVTNTTNADLPVGNGPGKYKTLDYGVSALAGFEIGKIFLRAEASQSLADMYQASGFKGSFKNQVIGVTLGVSLDLRMQEPPKKMPDTTAKKPEIKDKDGDGIADKDDDCPKDKGTAATKGCPDRDGDGVADKDDKCPDQKGSVANHGCPLPDRDGDGVPDNEDKCPDQKGTLLNNGCPVAGADLTSKDDSDGDGVPDSIDKCPNVKGLIRYDGCPIPDTDGDGVNDEIDHCKTVPGTAANHGCPEKNNNNNEAVEEDDDSKRPPVDENIVKSVGEIASRIRFAQSEYTLNAAGKKVLDQVVTILKNNPNLKLRIEGHASQEGDHYVNLALSNSRALSVKNYLVSKGIDVKRLKAFWYGNDRPVTDDPARQAQNRRVELKPY